MLRLRNSFTALSIAISAMAFCQFTPGLNTYAAVGATNDGFSTFAFSPIDSGFSDTGAFVQASGGQTFGGMNSSGDPDTMEFSGAGSASAQYGQLKTTGSGSVMNSFYNSDNPWYYNSDTGDTNPDGTPDIFLGIGQAQYQDVFTYNNIGAAVTVNFFYQVSGTFSGESVYHSIYVENDGDTDLLFLDTSDGTNFNFTWVTKNFLIGGDGMLNHSATVISQFDMRTYAYGDGSNVMGAANFGSTVTLSGMELRDINGDVVGGWSMSSGSGTNYPVPEPASMTILGAAVLGLIAKKRKK